MLKLNRLFYSTVVSETFSERIAPTPEHKRILNEARVAIRERRIDVRKHLRMQVILAAILRLQPGDIQRNLLRRPIRRVI